MALAITDTRGMSSNDCERGLLDTFLVKAFLPTSGLVWKIKMLKPFWGRIALYLDPSLADLRFARGWILLMTRDIIVCSDRFPTPFYYFQGSYKIQRERFIAIMSCQHQLNMLGFASYSPWKTGQLTNYFIQQKQWHFLIVLVWLIFLSNFYPYELLGKRQMASIRVPFLWAPNKGFSLNNQVFFYISFPSLGYYRGEKIYGTSW